MQVSFNALNADYLLQDFHVYRRSDQYLPSVSEKLR